MGTRNPTPDGERRGRASESMEMLILYRWQVALAHLDRDPADVTW
jgi:hypothetical protein